jgi:Na+-transporting NADH:ubiquinone oxidoreductase subunit F
MSIEIDINRTQRTISGEPGQSLLTALGANGVFIPSACGGRAICGMCKVKVIAGGGPLTTGELRLLGEKEKVEGIRLSCQVPVTAGLALEIPEELFIAKRFRSRVVSNELLTHDTRELRVRLLSPERMVFRAGQFAQLVIPPHDGVAHEIVRAYSIATPPSRSGELDFNVRLVPNGIASTFVNERVQPGDDIDLIGPMGEFGLREGDADMICIAGGSGMAPVKSILLDMYERKVPKRSVWYFFGAVTRADLFYVEFFRELEKSWPLFHFVPALSAPEPGDGWTGEIGLIPDVTARFLDASIDRTSPKEAYLCGSPGFINASVKMLTAHGVEREHIHFDRFV